MSAWLDELIALVTPSREGDAETIPSAEELARLEEATSAPAAEDDLPSALARLGALLERTPGALRARYARALLQERSAEPAAVRGYARTAEELAAARRWPEARAVARRAVSLPGGGEAAPLLLRCAAQVGQALDPADLKLAAKAAPHDPAVLWAQAQAQSAAGHASRAAEFAVRAAAGFLEHRELALAEEALLLALDRPTPALARELLALLPSLAAAEAAELTAGALDLLEPVLDEYHQWPALADRLEEVLRQGTPDPEFRRRYVDAVARVHGEVAVVRQAAEESGLLDPAADFSRAQAAFRKVLDFAKGALVRHSSWGLGEIVASVPAGFIIDFPGKPGHKMARAMGERSLLPVPPHSLAAQLYREGPQMKAEASADPVALLLRVIEDGGGEARAEDFKKGLLGKVVPEDDWTVWWKRARTLATADPRIDHSHAFSGHYRRAGGERVAVEFPPLRRPDGLGKAMQVVRGLLEQHPEQAAAAREQYGPLLADWVKGEETAESRALALLQLAAWYPDRRAAWARRLADLLAESRSLNVLTAAPDQQAALELAREAGEALPVFILALGSRYATVRDWAAQELEQLGPALPAAVGEHLGSSTTPAAVQIPLAELLLRHPDWWTDTPDPWVLLLALLRALADVKAARDLAAARALLAPDRELARLLRGRQCPAALEIAVEEGLAQLASRAAPAEVLRQFLAAAGQEGYEQYLQHRPRASREGLAPELDDRLLLMTRATWEQKVARCDQLKTELAGEIPRMIAAARALGDLSENADYHAARERQGLAAAEVRALEALLEMARLIEDLDPDGSSVAAGTEVVLRPLDGGDERRYWILGQDDQHHGPEVLNYRAPLGQALLGKQRGDPVALPLEQGETPFTVAAVRRRLPQ